MKDRHRSDRLIIAPPSAASPSRPMPPLYRWISALTLTPSAVFGAVTHAAAPVQPVAVPPVPPVTDFGTLFNEAFFLRLGFSFMVGLAVGYALKIAFKLALVAIGVILIGIFALQYAGIAQVDWSGMEGHYDSWAGSLSVNGAAFLDFIGHNLSNSASFIAGLALGLKI